MILGHILCYRFWFTKMVCVQEVCLNNLFAKGKRTLEFPNFSCQVSSCKFEFAKVSINTVKILSIKLTHATSKWFPRVISTFHLHVQCIFVELSQNISNAVYITSLFHCWICISTSSRILKVTFMNGSREFNWTWYKEYSLLSQALWKIDNFRWLLFAVELSSSRY